MATAENERQAKAAFEVYKQWNAMSDDDPGYDDATKAATTAWEKMKKLLGKDEAQAMFWSWAKTLPEYQFGMCDPDGN